VRGTVESCYPTGLVTGTPVIHTIGELFTVFVDSSWTLSTEPGAPRW